MTEKKTTTISIKKETFDLLTKEKLSYQMNIGKSITWDEFFLSKIIKQESQPKE